VGMDLGMDLPGSNGSSLSTVGRREIPWFVDWSADVNASARHDLVAALRRRYA